MSLVVFPDNPAQASAGGFRSTLFFLIRHNASGISYFVIMQVVSVCSILCDAWSESLVRMIDLLVMH